MFGLRAYGMTDLFRLFPTKDRGSSLRSIGYRDAGYEFNLDLSPTRFTLRHVEWVSRVSRAELLVASRDLYLFDTGRHAGVFQDSGLVCRQQRMTERGPVAEGVRPAFLPEVFASTAALQVVEGGIQAEMSGGRL